MRYVITGAGRGIGFEFVQQLLRREDTVTAGVRGEEALQRLLAMSHASGNRLRVHSLDVTDPASVHAFAENVCREPVDVLINNAGVSGQWCGLAELDFQDMADTFATNTLGPLRVTHALLPGLRRGGSRKVAHLTSRMGSIAFNTEGGAYAYRMSKAALNMGVRSMSHELRSEGFVTVVLHPGWVKTDMGGPSAPNSVAESVGGMLRVIDGLAPEHSGRFFDFQGEELPW